MLIFCWSSQNSLFFFALFFHFKSTVYKNIYCFVLIFFVSYRGDIRNIEVPEREFSRSSQSVSPVRPVTAPARSRRARSPSHPNYKEGKQTLNVTILTFYILIFVISEAYLQSTVVLRYVGHTDHYTRLESRARHR